MGSGRRGGGCGRVRGGTGGAPGVVRVGSVSKSATKASRDGIGRGKKRGISTIPSRCSSAMRAFVADLDKPRRRGPRGRGAADRVTFSRRVAPGRVGFFPARAVVLHIGEGCPRGWIPDFPRDYGVITRTSVSSERAPMCRTNLSAHGRTSTVLNAGTFPHDSADPPPVGSS